MQRITAGLLDLATEQLQGSDFGYSAALLQPAEPASGVGMVTVASAFSYKDGDGNVLVMSH